jgi:hypothetical protein
MREKPQRQVEESSSLLLIKIHGLSWAWRAVHGCSQLLYVVLIRRVYDSVLVKIVLAQVVVAFCFQFGVEVLIVSLSEFLYLYPIIIIIIPH